MTKIEILKIYRKEDVPSDLEFEFDTKHPEKPHWILLKNLKQRPRFLSVKTPQNSELTYKAFGNFFYPIEHLPSQEVQKTLMEVVAGKYDEIVGNLNIEIANFIFSKVRDLNLPKSIQILDLGAGTGLTSVPFARNGYKNITMVDLSEEMKKVATEKEIFRNIEYLTQNATNLNLPRKYDLVISGMFLCDLNDEERKKCFKLLVKHLNPNAHIAIVEDEERKIYPEYFEPISTGTALFSEYTKYFFIGKLK